MRFRDFLAEQPHDIIRLGVDSIGLENSKTRRYINDAIQRVTNEPFLTPYIGYGAVQRVLAYSSILMPQHMFMDVEGGEFYFDVSPLAYDGNESDGPEPEKYYVFFQYEPTGDGKFLIFASLVTDEELMELLEDDVEDVEEDS